MGYYTDYELTMSFCTVGMCHYTTSTIPDALDKSLSEEIEKMKVFEYGDVDLGYYASAKWYDWEKDMILLSKRFPGVLFCLHGEGDSSDDMWNAYFFEGGFQFCPAVITYDEFDSSKLIVSEECLDDTKEVYSNQ